MVKVPGSEAVLRGVLDEWKAGIDAHDPARVAAVFADDAIFQGLRPYSVGPQGVSDYYASQPLGMTVEYRISETRRPAPDVVLGYVSAEFSYTDRDPVHLNIGVLVVLSQGQWRIGFYEASSVPG
ncbi:hypothetical protein MSMEI_5563 [Mycolicibacterium smegmatis MC2 155]|uniref:SnoaL-like domain-containing protein n=1 Tax=Mycolicibacterium smegmatis (strain ATCC 700084 / mc(2)155) TaxID=246196 RepID=I7FT10_MYCS2|nr:hypothetical protein MSMEI_5563 [Mycolicibacterium smegmatis MC2 155]